MSEPGADPLVSRYERIEILRRYLRDGVLPWWAVLANPDLTAETALSWLDGLSGSDLRSVLAGQSDVASAVARAMATLSDDAMARLTARLLPSGMAADAPMRAALAEFSGQAKDRRAFHAGAMVALIEGKPLDFDALAGRAMEPHWRRGGKAATKPLADWPPDALKSQLLARLRFGAAPSRSETAASGATPADVVASEVSAAALLQALVAAYPDDARQFLRVVAAAPRLRSAFARHIATAPLHAVLREAHAEEARAVRRIMAQLDALALPHRPLAEEQRRALLLDTALRLAEGGTWLRATPLFGFWPNGLAHLCRMARVPR